MPGPDVKAVILKTCFNWSVDSQHPDGLSDGTVDLWCKTLCHLSQNCCVHERKKHSILTGNIYLRDPGVCISKGTSCFLEEERGQKRKRELDEEGEEDEDD